MTREPLTIPCEGAGCPTVSGICPMCGHPMPSPTPEHERLDILAMLDRGDYDR